MGGFNINRNIFSNIFPAAAGSRKGCFSSPEFLLCWSAVSEGPEWQGGRLSGIYPINSHLFVSELGPCLDFSTSLTQTHNSPPTWTHTRTHKHAHLHLPSQAQQRPFLPLEWQTRFPISSRKVIFDVFLPALSRLLELELELENRLKAACEWTGWGPDGWEHFKINGFRISLCTHPILR